MQALDRQVMREMQRSPEERELHGVQKWEPINRRVELVAAFVMNALGDDEVGLDSLLIMAQAFPKALRLVMEDLGEDGLGGVRAAYCREAMEAIRDDAERAKSLTGGGSALT